MLGEQPLVKIQANRKWLGRRNLYLNLNFACADKGYQLLSAAECGLKWIVFPTTTQLFVAAAVVAFKNPNGEDWGYFRPLRVSLYQKT